MKRIAVTARSASKSSKGVARPAKKIETAQPGGDVDAFLAALSHPLKSEIDAVRGVLLGASPSITDGIKWNSLSFRTTEFFATIHLRSTEQVQLVFHLGAKARPDVKAMQVADPAGLMKWLGKDRALVSLGAGAALKKNLPALEAIVREWIRYV